MRALFLGKDGAGRIPYRHARSKSGETQKQIAKRLGIAHGVITKFKQREGHWSPQNLSASEVGRLRYELEKAGLWSPGRRPQAKWTAATIADHFKVSRSVVCKLLRNKTYNSE